MATIVTRAGKGAALTHQEVDANFTGLNTELGQKEVASNKGVANGYASLDAAGKVPSAQLPSYVDDVVEAANLASLPGTGETGKIYVTLDTNKTYRWSGSAYVEISPSPGSTDSLAEGSTNLYFTQARARASVSASGSLSYNSSTGVFSFSDAVTSVAGRTGAVTLTSSDVGLGNVENKSSATIRGELTSSNVTTALGFTPYNATNPSSYISGNQTITVSGDASGSGATAIALTLANSGVAAGTYTKVTVDAKGRVTTGASLASGDLPTYTGTITSSQVTTALGFTPYNSTNPAGYITSSASITGASRFVDFLDNRSVNDQPQGKQGYRLSADFKENTAVGSPPVTAHASYSHILTLAGWDTVGGSGGFPSQLSVGDGIAVRQATNATTWGAWRTLLHSNNFNSYSPTLTGGGASGTWGINITGNAATVTNGVTSSNVASFAIPASTNVQSVDLNQVYNSGLYGFDVPTNSPGFSYGHLLVMRGRPDTIGQLAIDYSTGQVSFRGAYLPNGSSTVGAVWSSWRRALDSANYTNYSPSLTGSGASGTWGISISGSAAQLNGLSSTQLFNNMGVAHSGFGSGFDSVSNFGPFFIQGNGQGPGTGSSQFYGLALGLGNEYAYGSFALQLAIPRYNSSDKYLTMRTREGGSWGSWTKIHAGYADSAGSATDSTKLPLSGGTLTGAIRAPQITAGGSTNTDANLGVQGTAHITGTIYYGGAVGNVNSWSSISTSSSGTHTFSGSRFIFDRFGYGSQPLIDMQSGAITFGQPTYAGSGITVNNASADGRGINLYSGSPTSPTYGLFFAQTGSFGTYGAVSADWATYFTMNSTAHRGWIFREHESLGNVAAISNQGNMTLRSHFEQGNNIARPNVSWSAGSTSTGMVIFYLPGTTSNYGMVHMVFDIYEYNGNAVSTVIVGGHNWSTSWYNVGANVIGQCGKEVRLGVKDGRFCVVFGTSGSSWEYGTIVLRKIHNASFYDNVMDMVGNWSATQTTTESFTNITGDLRALRTPASFNAGGAITQAGNQVLHAGNYTSYAPSLGGSGASGTWGINITGNADTVDSLHASSFSRKDTTNQWIKPYYEYGSYLTSETPANLRDQMGGGGLRVDFLHPGYTGSGGWNHVITWSGYNVYNMYQLGGHYDGGTGTDLWVRSEANHTGTSWTAWRKLLNSSNYTSYAPSLTGSGASGTWSINVTGSAGSLAGGGTINNANFNGIMQFPSGGGGSTFGSNHYSMGKDVANGGWSHPHYADLIIGYHTGVRIGAAYSGIRFYNNSPTTDANNDGNGDQGESLLMTVGGYTGGTGVVVNNTLTAGNVLIGANQVLHASNYTSYSPPYSGGTLTGTWYFTGNGNTGSSSGPALQAYSTGGNGAYMSFHRGGHYAVNMGLDSDNVFRIGGWSASANRLQMDMSGNLTMAGNVTAYSDERLKKDWSVIESGFVERLAVMRCGTYTRIDSGQRQVGVSAQNMREILPEVVSEDNDGTLALAYGNAALVSAVELAKELVALKHKVSELEARVH